MKICEKCGDENPDNAIFCNNCGSDLDTVDTQYNQYDFNPETSYNQQQYNSSQTYQEPKQKITWLAPLLNVILGLIYYFLSGLGYFYLGLYKRGITICLLGLVPMIIGALIIVSGEVLAGTLVSLILGLLLIAYSAYDSYNCTKAINEYRPLPLLFGKFDVE